jgi:hypothetical protein
MIQPVTYAVGLSFCTDELTINRHKFKWAWYIGRTEAPYGTRHMSRPYVAHNDYTSLIST